MHPLHSSTPPTPSLEKSCTKPWISNLKFWFSLTLQLWSGFSVDVMAMSQVCIAQMWVDSSACETLTCRRRELHCTYQISLKYQLLPEATQSIINILPTSFVFVLFFAQITLINMLCTAHITVLINTSLCGLVCDVFPGGKSLYTLVQYLTKPHSNSVVQWLVGY